jgi:hypothetical protein
MKKVLLAAMLLGIQQTSARNYTEYSYFSGIYVGAGVGGTIFKIKAEKKDGDNVEKASQNGNQISFYSLFGSSKELNGSPFCVGGEIGIEISTSKNKEVTLGNEKAELTSHGANPSVGFWVGYVMSDHAALIFLKGGVAYGKTRLKNYRENLTNSQLAPFVGVGVQKALCSTWHVRISLDTEIKTSKSNDHYNLENRRPLRGRFIFIRNIKF